MLLVTHHPTPHTLKTLRLLLATPTPPTLRISTSLLVTLVPPTLKTSTSLLVMSFLALCFQGTRNTVWAELIQRSPGYLPLLMAFSSHAPNRSLWASLRARDRHRGNRDHPETATRGGPGVLGAAYPSSGAAMGPGPQSRRAVPCRAGR